MDVRTFETVRQQNASPRVPLHAVPVSQLCLQLPGRVSGRRRASFTAERSISEWVEHRLHLEVPT